MHFGNHVLCSDLKTESGIQEAQNNYENVIVPGVVLHLCWFVLSRYSALG
jgi:hypothetical protein